MNPPQQLMELLQQQPIVRSRDIEEIGISRVYLQRLTEQGVLERVGRGLYTLTENVMSQHSSLIEVAMHAPKGVICLLSALQFHQLTTQLPFAVWLAIEGNGWSPKLDQLSLNVVRFSGDAFHYGIEIHELSGIPVKIYSVAKTIADCFKYRNKIGLGVALEALKDAFREKRVTVDEVWQASNVCRVQNIIKPYLETIV